MTRRPRLARRCREAAIRHWPTPPVADLSSALAALTAASRAAGPSPRHVMVPVGNSAAAEAIFDAFGVPEELRHRGEGR